MRVLSLGLPLPGPALDNATFASAQTFFDYDAIVVDPAALSTLIEDVVEHRAEHTARTGERVTNGESGPAQLPLAELLRARRDETARLLERGGAVVCLAEPNAVHQGVAGFAGCDRYCWLPAPPGVAYAPPLLRRGAGSEIVSVRHDHPFGAFVAALRGRLAYRAYVDDTHVALQGVATVFARSAGGAAAGVELPVAQGRVVLIPGPARAPSSEQRYEFANALIEALRQTLRLGAPGGPPAWLAAYPLPGVAEREEQVERAQEALQGARDALDGARQALDEVDRYRRLLWQEGRDGLEAPVRDAMALLGFRVLAPAPDAPAELQPPDGPRLLLEVDASEDVVGMNGHYRLRQRLEESIAKGAQKRGLLVINGHRAVEPSDRPQQYEDALRVAAESMRYCVATTEQLFHAVRAALEGDETTVAAFRERLLAAEGVLRED